MGNWFGQTQMENDEKRSGHNKIELRTGDSCVAETGVTSQTWATSETGATSKTEAMTVAAHTNSELVGHQDAMTVASYTNSELVGRQGSIAKANMDNILLEDLFSKCIMDEGILDMDNYTEGFENTCRYLKTLGYVFSFVLADVVEKIGILREYRQSESGEEYKTIQSMIRYEVENNLTINEEQPSGCRTLLRLHRGLEFVIEFKQNIKEAGEDANLTQIISKAYEKTISRFHPWITQKAVYAAVYTLPYFKDYLKTAIADVNRIQDISTDAERKVYDITQQLYTDNNLHGLL